MNEPTQPPEVGMITYHLAQSIRGPLTNWKTREWKNATKWITKPDGSKFTVAELKQSFLDELAKGHEVVPVGECDNFDFKTGCNGHPQTKKP